MAVAKAIHEQYNEDLMRSRINVEYKAQPRSKRKFKNSDGVATASVTQSVGRAQALQNSVSENKRVNVNTAVTWADRARAASACAGLLYFLGMLWFAQLFFAILAMASMGLLGAGQESFFIGVLVDLVSIFIDIEGIFAFAMITTMAIGMLSAALIITRFIGKRVAWLSGEGTVLKYIALMTMFPLYFFPVFTNLVPWALIYALIVIWYPK